MHLSTLLSRVVRFPFMLIPAGSVVRIVQGPARGKRWISNSASHGFWLGFWEQENQRRFAARLKPGDVVYDVGAHVGMFMLVSSSRVSSEGHVYAFDPFPRNAEYLRRHVELNRLSNCTVVESAVCSSNGLRRFDPSSCRTASEGHLSDSGTEMVQALSLDTFLSSAENRRPPNVIKISVEGAEMEVLHGGLRTITEHAPMIFLSTNSDDLDRQCCEFLRAGGYSVERLAANTILAEKGK